MRDRQPASYDGVWLDHVFPRSSALMSHFFRASTLLSPNALIITRRQSPVKSQSLVDDQCSSVLPVHPKPGLLRACRAVVSASSLSLFALLTIQWFIDCLFFLVLAAFDSPPNLPKAAPMPKAVKKPGSSNVSKACPSSSQTLPHKRPAATALPHERVKAHDASLPRAAHAFLGEWTHLQSTGYAEFLAESAGLSWATRKVAERIHPTPSFAIQRDESGGAVLCSLSASAGLDPSTSWELATALPCLSPCLAFLSPCLLTPMSTDGHLSAQPRASAPSPCTRSCVRGNRRSTNPIFPAPSASAASGRRTAS